MWGKYKVWEANLVFTFNREIWASKYVMELVPKYHHYYKDSKHASFLLDKPIYLF